MTRRREYKRRFTRATFNSLVRDARRNEVLEALSAAGPQVVYAGLLAYGRDVGKYERWRGWAFYRFPEIFGAKPRSQDQNVEPKAAPELMALIEEWVALRKRKARPRQRE